MADQVMRVVEWRDADVDTRRQLLERGHGLVFDDALRADIAGLVDEVRHDGDAAVVRALARFDDVHIDAHRLRVTDEEFAEADREVGEAVKAAIADLIDHVRRYNEHKRADQGDWSMEMEPGLAAGEKVSPIVSAGLFVPSGIPIYILPLIVFIEVLSFLSRPISHSVRLFANMLAGHITLKVFASFITLLGGLGFLGWMGAVLPLVLVVALTALELLVAFLQAFVFAALATVYLNEVVNFGHGH
jgi:hypothetical protein